MNNDLISRSELKKALKSNCDTLCKDKNTNWCEHCCPINDFKDLIDNAPTVEPEPYFEKAEKDKRIYERGFEDGQNARPQGEAECMEEDAKQASIPYTYSAPQHDWKCGYPDSTGGK